jgi:hypothetical protein
MAMTGQDIYDNFHQHARGTSSWQGAQHAAAQISQELPGQAVRIKRLQDAMEAAWTGNAADAAQRGVTPLALEHLNVADDLHATQDLMSRQAASFHQAANAVRPMPPEPTMQDPLAAIAAGQTPDTMLAQVTRYNTLAQHNVDAMTTYAGASRYNTQNMPATYGTLADNPVTITIHPTPGNGTSTGPSGPTTSRRPGRPTTPGGITPAGGQSPPPDLAGPAAPSGGVSAPAAPGDPGRGGDSTGTSGTGGAAAGTSIGGAVGTGRGGDGAVSGGPGLVGAPMLGDPAKNLVGRLGSGGVGEAVKARPDVRGGLGEPGGGLGRLGAGPAGGSGEGEPVGATPPDRGGQSAVGRGVSDSAVVEQEAVGGRSGGQAQGEAGLPGVGVPASGQRGERDDDHHRTYPVVTDLETVFSSGILKVAPEVFGESPQQRAARHEREAEGDH